MRTDGGALGAIWLQGGTVAWQGADMIWDKGCLKCACLQGFLGECTKRALVWPLVTSLSSQLYKDITLLPGAVRHPTLTQIQPSGSLRWSRAELRRPRIRRKAAPRYLLEFLLQYCTHEPGAALGKGTQTWLFLWAQGREATFCLRWPTFLGTRLQIQH